MTQAKASGGVSGRHAVFQARLHHARCLVACLTGTGPRAGAGVKRSTEDADAKVNGPAKVQASDVQDQAMPAAEPPATNCGKNETKAVNAIKFFVGANFL